MPPKLRISAKDRARRHVLGQQLYRLRRRYKYLNRAGLSLNAGRIRVRILALTGEYDALGGPPHHRGTRL